MDATLFTNVQIIDGSGAAAFAGEVLIEGNRIKAVAREGAALERDGATVVDGGGQVLMPGLIEATRTSAFATPRPWKAWATCPPRNTRWRP